MSESEFEYDEPAEDEEAFVDEDDFFVKRDGKGDVLPQTVRARGYGMVKVRPMVYGEVEKYFGDNSMAEVEAEAVAEIIRSHVRKPDLSSLTATDLRERMEPLAPQALLMAVMNASGIDADIDVDDEGDATVSLEGNSRR